MAAELTLDWLDASDVRPVPDHQEVWTEPAGRADRALLIELNEALPSELTVAVREHFDELYRVDGCASASVLSVEQLQPAQLSLSESERQLGHHPAVALAGTHSRADGTCVLVSLVLVRLQAQSTDLLIVIYRPIPEARLPPSSTDIVADAALAASVRNTLLVQDWGLFQTA